MPVAEKHELRAVYDDDLEALLKSLGIYGAFTAGRLRCSFCKDTITWDNLHSLFPDSGAVKCSCDRPQCIKALTERLAPSGLQEPTGDWFESPSEEDGQTPPRG